MRLSESHIRHLAVIVLLAFIGVRFGDAHLHMCLDGQEAPLTVHAADGSVHNDAHHQETDHEDRDLDVFDTALLKAGSGVDMLFIAVAFFIVPVVPPSISSKIRSVRVPPRKPLSQLRPPLRGPPL